MPRYTRESFIRRSVEKFGDKFDYSKFEYNGMNTKSCFICKKHGEFWTTPQVHILSATGCPKCGKEHGVVKNTLTTEEFIKKAREIHGDKYDYSKTVYIKSMDPVIITCPEHGDFMQKPNNHLKGHGCPMCVPQKVSNDDFISECKSLYGGKYSFDKTHYENAATMVTVTCPKHGDFGVIPKTLLKGEGCPFCEREKKFIERAVKKYGNKYDYSKVVYYNSITPVCIVDKEHGEFWQKPTNHLNGSTGTNVIPTQYEHCVSVAKKYNFMYDFYIKERKQYSIAKRNGWLNEFKWLKIDGILEIKNRLIYAYEFTDRFVYVGLTNNLKRRDRQHRGFSVDGEKKEPKHDSLYQYAKSNGVAIPEPKILEEKLTAEESKFAERKWMKFYSDKGWVLINKCPGGSIGSSPDFFGEKNNIEELVKEIKTYKNGEEIRRKKRTLYNKMIKYGLGKICFPQNAKRKSHVYSEEFILSIVEKYPTKKLLRQNDCGAYQYFWEHGLLDKFYPKR